MPREPSASLAGQPELSLGPSWSRPSQNWILDPLQDSLFIVAAPLLVLALALTAFFMLGAAAATALIVTVHIVLTVAHHLPTFIRVYGDVELFRRFKWSFVLGPLLPFGFAMAMGAYLIAHERPIENLLYLFLLAALWDPWHFLMQHYGFMRIYDRHNEAPRKLAGRMDLLLCASWFVAIMLASGDWLPEILEDLYQTAQLPLIMALPLDLVPLLTSASLGLALAATAAYLVYLLWCRRQHYFISATKLALFGVTFGAMYLAYTPNAWILDLAPGWTFKVGFAAIGIVHMTQYLAIVWRYNRNLATQRRRARAGLFRRLHAHGGKLLGGGYVLLCLFYGETLTATWDSRWLMALLIAAGFTSTLMHYYFDGFIWKLRHQQNRESLALPEAANGQAAASWWSSGGTPSALTILLRQLIYFGLPLSVLTYGALSVWNGAQANYVAHMVQAHLLSQKGLAADALAEARQALDAMNRQLPYARKIAALQPTSAHEASLALMVFNQSQYEQLLIPSLTGQTTTAEQLAAHAERVDEAASLLDQALRRGGPLAHAGYDKLNPEDGQRLLASWQAQLQQLPEVVAQRRASSPAPTPPAPLPALLP